MSLNNCIIMFNPFICESIRGTSHHFIMLRAKKKKRNSILKTRGSRGNRGGERAHVHEENGKRDWGKKGRGRDKERDNQGMFLVKA